MVVLRNDDGVRSLPIRLKVTERIRPDLVYMVHGFGHNAPGLHIAHGRGASDTAQFMIFDRELRSAVASEDPLPFVLLATFPLDVFAEDGSRSLNDPKTLVLHIGTVLTPKVRAAVASPSPPAAPAAGAPEVKALTPTPSDTKSSEAKAAEVKASEAKPSPPKAATAKATDASEISLG